MYTLDIFGKVYMKKIIIAIFKKIASADTISNYNEILNAVST